MKWYVKNTNEKSNKSIINNVEHKQSLTLRKIILWSSIIVVRRHPWLFKQLQSFMLRIFRFCFSLLNSFLIFHYWLLKTPAACWLWVSANFWGYGFWGAGRCACAFQCMRPRLCAFACVPACVCVCMFVWVYVCVMVPTILCVDGEAVVWLSVTPVYI